MERGQARDKKFLKAKAYEQYWKYQLSKGAKHGEGRANKRLRNDCLSVFMTIKERKIVKKILKHLAYLH
jgi:hypothetical protein